MSATMTNESIMVSVLCATYNQKKYISQSLESILAQKTDFPFEVIVRDDCSTDGTTEIVMEYARKYPGKVVPLVLQENHYSHGKNDIAFMLLFRLIRGKYFAVCEGDDFWTDPEKLQIQVDFMEAHPEYSMCCHSSYITDEKGTIRKDKVFRSRAESGDLSAEKIISGWSMATNTLMVRTSSWEDPVVPFQGKCLNEDYGLEVYTALKGKVFFLDRLMGAYRMNANGSMSIFYKDHPDILKERTFEFCSMLDRLNEYTNQKYENVIRKYRQKKLFDMYAVLGDKDNMKKHKAAYADASLPTRIIVGIRTCCPKLFNTIKDFYRKIWRWASVKA